MEYDVLLLGWGALVFLCLVVAKSRLVGKPGRGIGKAAIGFRVYRVQVVHVETTAAYIRICMI